MTESYHGIMKNPPLNRTFFMFGLAAVILWFLMMVFALSILIFHRLGYPLNVIQYKEIQNGPKG